MLRGACVCWIRIAEERYGPSDDEGLKAELKEVVKILGAAVDAERWEEWKHEVDRLVSADLRLKILFAA